MNTNDLRVPPQDLPAEQSVLGALMTEPDAISQIADSLAEDDFYDRRHGTIYGAMLKLFEERSPIDILTVSSELKKGDLINSIGGDS